MSTTAQRRSGIKPDILKAFSPLDILGNEERALLATQTEAVQEPKGRKLFEVGDQGAWAFFLLQGTLSLKSSDGNVHQIEAGSEHARRPIANLFPRRYTAITATPCLLLQINNALLANVFADPDNAGVHSDDIADPGELLNNPLFQDIYNDLLDDRLVIPTLPKLAVKIRRSVQDPNINSNRLARVIQTDPALTGKLLKAANSVLYRRATAADTCAKAITRIGFDTTRHLVTSFLMRHLFSTRNPYIKSRMKKLWQHSINVASISFVLAQQSRRVDPETALLAGLMHDIGVLAVLNYAEKHRDIATDPKRLDKVINGLRAKTGAIILKKWGFKEDMVTVALEAEHYLRDHGEKADLCDFVNIAQLHSYLGTDTMKSLPLITDVPAFHKMPVGELTPQLSLRIIEDAKEQIAEIRTMLA